MSTVNQNAVKYGAISGDGMKKIHFPVSSSFEIKQGELVYLDTSAHIIKSLDSDAHAATLAGVALAPSKISSNIDLSTAPAEKTVMVGWDVVAFFKTTAAETYYHGTPVYIGADAQTITTVAGSNMIGRVVLPAGVSSVAGATGVTVDVLVKSAL